MKQQEHEEARGLLFLKAKLVRLRIEAENLRLCKVEEREARQSDRLMMLADVAFQLSQTYLLSQHTLLPTSRQRHWIWLMLAVMLGLSG